MKIARKRTTKVLSYLIAAVLAFALIPAAAPSAATVTAADPDALLVPGIYDATGDGIDALKSHIASLEKIIELNVGRAEKVPVLLYHHLVRSEELTSAQEQNDSVMTVEQFSEQMKFLYDNKYYTASLYELELYIGGKMILPERTVVITFDDGYRSNTRYAYPILKQYDFKASIFLITGLISVRENVIEHATWDDLKKCGDVFSYHSHSHDLHRLLRDGRSAFAAANSSSIAEDLLISKALLSTSYVAYPYGQSNRAVKRAMSDAGYRMGFTTVADYAKRRMDTLEIPRFTITKNYDLAAFEAICSGAVGPAPEGDEPPAAQEAV